MAQVGFTFASSQFVNVIAGASQAAIPGVLRIESIRWNASTTPGNALIALESLGGMEIFRAQCVASYDAHVTPWLEPKFVHGLIISMPAGSAIITKA